MVVVHGILSEKGAESKKYFRLSYTRCEKYIWILGIATFSFMGSLEPFIACWLCECWTSHCDLNTYKQNKSTIRG